MKRDQAEKFMELFLALDGPLNAAGEFSMQLDSVEEQRQIRRAIAKAVTTVFSDLMVPIVRQYPGLEHSVTRGSDQPRETDTD